MNIELTQQAMSGTLHSAGVNGTALSPEDLLIDAATFSLKRRAGVVIGGHATEALPRAICEQREVAPDAATDMLDHVANCADRSLLREWIMLCNYAGYRAPAHHVGSLLNLAVMDDELLENVIAIAGCRGWWLARQRRDWLHVYLAIQPETYMDRNLSIRTRLPSLRLLRQSDPAMARCWLQKWLFKESDGVHVALLRTLKTGLSLDDEPYLESLLQNRHNVLVADEAANLLTCMSGSAYVRRMIERMQQALLWRENGSLQVVKYEFMTESMGRDAIDRYFFHSRDLEKDNWYWAMLAAVPPAFWTAHFNTNITTLLDMTTHPDSDTQLLLKGWIDAAVHHGDRKWLQALLHWLLEHRSNQLVDYFRCRYIVQALPPSTVEDQLIRSVIEAPDDARHILDVLTHCHHNWSKTFSTVIIDYVHRLIVEGCTYNDKKIHRMLQEIENLGLYMYPGSFFAAVDQLNTLPEAAEFLNVLGLRYEMWRAFGLLEEGY